MEERLPPRMRLPELTNGIGRPGDDSKPDAKKDTEGDHHAIHKTLTTIHDWPPPAGFPWASQWRQILPNTRESANGCRSEHSTQMNQLHPPSLWYHLLPPADALVDSGQVESSRSRVS